MKFIVSSQQLAKNLQSISGILTSSSTIPIIQNFLFSIKDESLTVTATDLETTMSATIPLSKVEGEGLVAVPSKMLLETLKSLPDVPCIFNIDDDTLSIEITANEGVYRLSGFWGDDFPKVPEIEDAKNTEINSSIIKNAVAKTLFAVGNDDMRIAMTGVLCELSPENITFVSTDAHKLVRYRRTDGKNDETVSFIIPKKPINQLKNTLPEEETIVKIEYSEKNVHFTFGNFNLIARLIDGKYPNYEAVIPLDNPNILTIERLLLLNSLRRVTIYANQTTLQVRLKVENNLITLTAEDVDFSNLAIEKIPCSYDGENMELGFNARFLQDMVNNIDTAEIRIEMSEPNKAVLLFPQNNPNEAEELTMLIMPVLINVN